MRVTVCWDAAGCGNRSGEPVEPVEPVVAIDGSGGTGAHGADERADAAAGAAGAAEKAVDVDVSWREGATVAELVAALCRELDRPDQPEGEAAGVAGTSLDGAGRGMAVDGVVHRGGRLLDDCEIHEGSVLCPVVVAGVGGERWGGGHRIPHSEVGRARWQVTVLTGPEAGRSRDLGPVPLSVGSHPSDPMGPGGRTSSGRCRLVDLGPTGVGLTDLGGGSRVEGRVVTRAVVGDGAVIDLGPTRLLIERRGHRPRLLTSTNPVGPRPGRDHSGTGRFAHTPPPSPVQPPPDPPVAPDPPPEPVRPARGPGAAALLAPLGMGAIMVVVMGNPMFALLAALGPLTLLGNRVESRLTHRRARRRRQEEVERAAEAHRRAMVAWRRARRRHAWQMTHLPGEPPVQGRALEPGLWVRRDGSGPLEELVVGVGTVGVPAAGGHGAEPVDDMPVTVDLSGGGTLGIVGPTGPVRALVTSLVLQAALAAAPSEVEISGAGNSPGEHGAASGSPLRPSWLSWLGWLPHGGGEGPVPSGRHRLVLHDLTGPRGRVIVSGERSPRTTLLIAAPTVAHLPPDCHQVVEVSGTGITARLWDSGGRADATSFTVTGTAAPRAERVARSLARLVDPRRGDGSEPEVGGLLSLIEREVPSGPEEPGPGVRWRRSLSLAAPVGTDAAGRVVELDLRAHGPHALVAGTTGSGKSEFLRTWLCSMALHHGPDTLGFVLVDYKGGAAFDRCAELPHTLGSVTDLDRDEAARALMGLEAELRRREERLRELGAGDVAELEPGVIPSLVLVVDEFAGLREDLPEFVEGLVALAQRGRSLGVHLILATQRPSGAVSADIAANMSLRVALRVQSPAESAEVVGTDTAATLPRSRPGSAVVAGIADRPVVLRAAPVCGPAPGDPRRKAAPVTVTRWGQDHVSTPVTPPGRCPRTELDQIVETVAKAAVAAGLRPQPRPWQDALPDSIALEALGVDSGEGPLLVARGDDPRARRQDPVGWEPGRGNLMLVGRSGSGPAEAVDALVARATERWGPDHLVVHVIGTGPRRPRWADPAVVGGDVSLDDLDLVELVVQRHLRILGDRLRHGFDPGGLRRGEDGRFMILVLDGCGPLIDRLSAPDTVELADGLKRIVTEGPAVGIHTLVTATRIGAVPVSWQASTIDRWAFDLADPLDRHSLGCPPVPAGHHGRARTLDGLEIQVARAPETEGVAEGPPCRGGFGSIGALPDLVDPAGLGPPEVDTGSGAITVPLGVGGEGAAPLAVELTPGDTFWILGRRGRGRSSALELFRRARAAAGAGGSEPPSMVLVDDAGCLDRPPWSPASPPPADLIVVVAVDPDVVGRQFGHWVRDLPRGRGLFLGPDPAEDGELLGARLPRWRGGPPRPGRGWLVAPGSCVRIQVAYSGRPTG